MKKTSIAITTAFLISALTSFAAQAGYSVGEKAVYEKDVVDFANMIGQRGVISWEILSYDSTTDTYKIEERESFLGQTGETVQVLEKKSSELILGEEAGARLAACTAQLRETLRSEMGPIATCRGSKDNNFEIFWFADVPFGFAHYEIYSEKTHVMTKYMMKSFVKKP